MKDDEEFVGEPNEFLNEDHVDDIDHEVKVAVGDETPDVYTEEGRDDLEESDEVAPWEEGFAEGAAHGGHLGDCAHCHAVLEEDVVEREIDGELFRFCCKSCAESGPKSE